MSLRKILYQPDIAVNGETSLFDVWSDDDLKWTGKRIEQECPPLLEPREPSDADNPPPSDRWTSPMKSPYRVQVTLSSANTRPRSRSCVFACARVIPAHRRTLGMNKLYV